MTKVNLVTQNHKQIFSCWENFLEKGFLTHAQSGINIKVFPLHPQKCSMNELEKFEKIMKSLEPKIVAIQMGEKFLIPDPKQVILSSKYRTPSGPELLVKNSFREALRESQKGRVFATDSFIDKLISIAHGEHRFEHVMNTSDNISHQSSCFSDSKKVVKFIDIPFLEHESPSNPIFYDLIQSARRRFRLKEPNYSSSRIGHWLYQFSLNRAFEGDVRARILHDQSTVDEAMHFYNIYKAFHPLNYHRYFELPSAVIAEKLRNLVRALYYKSLSDKQRANAVEAQNFSEAEQEYDNINESGFSEKHMKDNNNLNVQSPTILLVVGKPYLFSISHFWQNYVENEKFNTSHVSSFHHKKAQVSLQDSIQNINTLIVNSKFSSSSNPDTEKSRHSSQEEGCEDDEDLIEAVVLQASTPLVRFTRPVKHYDVVLDHHPRALPIQKKRDKNGYLIKDEKVADSKRTPFGFRYLE